jgi:hypothetical protein
MSEGSVKSGQGPKNPSAAQADRSHPAAPAGEKAVRQIERTAHSPIPVHRTTVHSHGKK